MTSKFILQDYKDFKSYLEKNNILPKNWKINSEKTLKKMHKIVYSFALWDFNFPKRKEHQRSFIREIRSESIQIIPLLLLGYMKPVKFLERGIIENSLKHIYFYDHPIEYHFLKTREKYFIKFNELIDYAKEHPKLKGKIERFGVLPRLYERYTKLSQHIHSKAVVGMELKKSLSKIKFSEKNFVEYGEEFYRCGVNINLLLSLFHKDVFDKIENNYDNFISTLFGRRYRGLFRDLW